MAVLRNSVSGKTIKTDRNTNHKQFQENQKFIWLITNEDYLTS